MKKVLSIIMSLLMCFCTFISVSAKDELIEHASYGTRIDKFDPGSSYDGYFSGCFIRNEYYSHFADCYFEKQYLGCINNGYFNIFCLQKQNQIRSKMKCKHTELLPFNQHLFSVFCFCTKYCHTRNTIYQTHNGN